MIIIFQTSGINQAEKPTIYYHLFIKLINVTYFKSGVFITLFFLSIWF